MKHFFKFVLIAICASICISSCGKSEDDNNDEKGSDNKVVKLKNFYFSCDTLEAILGKTMKFCLDSTGKAVSDGDKLYMIPNPISAKINFSEVEFVSDNTDVLVVNNDGTITFKSEGTAILDATLGDITASIKFSVVLNKYGYSVTGIIDGYEYVDLGLKVMWATANVGASTPVERGDYFAWGETSSKNDYSWETYKWGDFEQKNYKKYGPDDARTEFDNSDDAASSIMGGNWRTPRAKDLEELMLGCNWEYIHDIKGSGVDGMMGTSLKNGNKIFIPFFGWKEGTKLFAQGSKMRQGQYLTRTKGENITESMVGLIDETGWDNNKTQGYEMCFGSSIRAVIE